MANKCKKIFNHLIDEVSENPKDKSLFIKIISWGLAISMVICSASFAILSFGYAIKKFGF
jgi:ABC-type nickel/cobalt efflux system permease component RcnA|tara:strand:+ start:962 stop:1141 length:180 start_codon:yes stop_codon:yes gene_type:complete